MDEFFGDMNVISITDSTMMRIAHAAMNKAHERVKSKDGVLVRLNEISKFYELAVMQLEGCTEFVQEESSHEEELLTGLLEIRNRLKARLNESETAIAEKDRELAERSEREARLRQALEVKERELVLLKARLETTRISRDGEFCEVKNSVDHQVEPDCGGRLGEEKIEQMGSDIDALMETLDSSFGKMRNTMFLSESGPVEQQWRWGVEKDTLCLVIGGFVRDVDEMFRGKVWRSRRGKESVGFDEFWACLIDEAAGLKNELDSLIDEHEAVVAPGKVGGVFRANLVLGEVDNDEGEESRHSVAKMIKNHESIIKQKSAEAEELRQEVMREKVLSSCRRDEPDSLRKRVQGVIAKLDSFVGWKDKLCEFFGDRTDGNEERIAFHMDTVSYDVNKELSEKIQKLEGELEDLDLGKKIMEETYFTLFEGLSDKLKFELCRCEAKCNDLLVEMKNQWDENIQSNNAELQIREEIYCVVFNEFIKDWNKNIETYDTDVVVKEEIWGIIFDETIGSIVDDANTDFHQREEAKLAEDSVKDEVCAVFFKKTSTEWKMKLEEFIQESLIKEQMFQLVVLEAAKGAFICYEDAASEDRLLGCKNCVKHESLMQNVVFEGHSVLGIGYELKGNEADLNVVGLESETSRKKNASSSDSNEALQKLATNGETLHETRNSLGLASGDDSPKTSQQKICTISFVQDRESSIVTSKVNGDEQLEQSDFEAVALLGFFQVMADFEHVVTEKSEMNSLRLEELNHNLNLLVEQVSSLREKELLYKRAFIRRCQNLHKAETEVDLLGDQVEGLLGLIQKIHTTLQHNSSVLHQNDWIPELLKLIKKELNGVIHATKH